LWQYLEYFAELFSRHWTYNWNTNRDIFLKIQSEIPVPESITDFDHDGDSVKIMVKGVLEAGDDTNNQGPDVGFTAMIETDIRLQGKEAFGAWHHPKRHYPCSHVPPPQWHAM
jgi:hypothetical protein